MKERQNPWPGCPASSIAKRRWINHNSCGSTTDSDEPEYYFSELTLGSLDSLRDYDGSVEPASIAAVAVAMPPVDGSAAAAGAAAAAAGQNAGPAGAFGIAPGAAFAPMEDAASLPYFCAFEAPEDDETGVKSSLVFLLRCEGMVVCA